MYAYIRARFPPETGGSHRRSSVRTCDTRYVRRASRGRKIPVSARRDIGGYSREIARSSSTITTRRYRCGAPQSTVKLSFSGVQLTAAATMTSAHSAISRGRLPGSTGAVLERGGNRRREGTRKRKTERERERKRTNAHTWCPEENAARQGFSSVPSPRMRGARRNFPLNSQLLT